MIVNRKEVIASSSLFRGGQNLAPSLAGTSLCIAPLSLSLAGPGRPGSTHVTDPHADLPPPGGRANREPHPRPVQGRGEMRHSVPAFPRGGATDNPGFPSCCIAALPSPFTSCYWWWERVRGGHGDPVRPCSAFKHLEQRLLGHRLMLSACECSLRVKLRSLPLFSKRGFIYTS